MTLRYEEVLTPQNGTFHYRYILGTERYSDLPLETASMTIYLQNSDVTNIYSPFYPIQTYSAAGNPVEVRWSAQHARLDQDFDLFFTSAADGFGASLLVGMHRDTPHFMFMFAPEMNVEPETALPKDIVFVMDRSGSMSGEKISQAQGALAQILARLNANDRFSIVGFDNLITTFRSTLQPVEPGILREAYAFVRALNARDATNISEALRTGLQIMNNSETRSDAARMIIFMTDGLANEGLVENTEIASLVRKHNPARDIRLHVFGVGYDVNTHLLDQLAAENGGAVTYVQPGENLEAVMTSFYGRIANPVLTDVQITFEGMSVTDIYPQTFPDMFRGSSLVVAGRFQPNADRVTVRVQGKAGDEEREYAYQFDLQQSASHDFVPRLWATRALGHLLDIVRVEGETEALRARIQTLGLEYGLATPYTTFIITPQSDGAASMENMSLYYDRTALNQASGATTIQARAQNQLYQDASQVNWAQGANIVNAGQYNLAQVGSQHIELSLFAQQDIQDGITPEWINQTIPVDQIIEFGSEDYFKLAADPEARLLLQNGTNLMFPYRGQVILIQDTSIEVER